MISHRNVIVNAMQQATYESVARKKRGIETQVVLGLLPLSHIYALVVIAHTGVWCGDEVIIFPRFELETFLEAIQRFKIEHLLVVRLEALSAAATAVAFIPARADSCQVPPIIIRLLRQNDICSKYDLSSVRFLFVGAAPTGEETIRDLLKILTSWTIGQGYGRLHCLSS